MLQTGQVLQNRYRVDGVLGQGGMGAVYSAFDQRLNRTFVVKEMLITSGVQTNPGDATRQFQKEAQVLADLRHPSLPVVTDYFADGGSYYLVMDLVEGQSLQKLILPGGLPEPVVLDVANQLLDTLQYIHSRGVLHRDIKPSNIIVQPNGRVVLVDFGLVKVIQGTGGLTTTAFAHGMGTPEYAPPEQATGRTDQRSDIYSLGATMYNALTGQAPASASDRVAEKPLLEPRRLQPGISARTEQVILRAMALMKSERYPDAGAMQAALAGKMSEPSSLTQPLPAASTATATRVIENPQPIVVQPQRRVQPLAWVGGLALVAVVIIALALLFTASKPTASPQTAPQPDVTVTAIAPSAAPTVILATDTPLPQLALGTCVTHAVTLNDWQWNQSSISAREVQDGISVWGGGYISTKVGLVSYLGLPELHPPFTLRVVARAGQPKNSDMRICFQEDVNAPGCLNMVKGAQSLAPLATDPGVWLFDFSVMGQPQLPQLRVVSMTDRVQPLTIVRVAYCAP